MVRGQADVGGRQSKGAKLICRSFHPDCIPFTLVTSSQSLSSHSFKRNHLFSYLIPLIPRPRANVTDMSEEQEHQEDKDKTVVEVKKEEHESQVEEEEAEDEACDVADVQDIIIASCEPVKKPTNAHKPIPIPRVVMPSNGLGLQLRSCSSDDSSDSRMTGSFSDSSSEESTPEVVVKAAGPGCGKKADGSALCAGCPARSFDRQPLNVQVKTVAPTRTVREVGSQTEQHAADEVRGLLDSRITRLASCPFLSSVEMELILSFGMGVVVTLLIQRLMRR